MNCVLYARVSTEKQADKELSIPAQLLAMREYAHQHGWTVVQEFIESGASARTADRPVLKQLLARCKLGEPKPEVVLVHKIDRFARNVYDYATVRAVLKQQGVRVTSVVENTDDSVSGELVENIMASIAQFYSANLGDEARKGMRQKVLNGGWPHKAPRGYASVRNSDGRGSHLVLHRRESALIRAAFELYATGHYAVRTLVERLAKDGLTAKSGRPIAASYLRRILENCFYTGRIKWGGLDVAGVHPALVTRELFERVQDVIARRYRDPTLKGAAGKFPLRRVAICAACRSHMTAERHDRWEYYRCGRNAHSAKLCPASLCNARKAHADLQQVLQQIRITSDVTNAIAQEADGIIKERVDQASQRRDELETSHSALLQQELHLTESFTVGDLSPNVYRLKAQELRDRRTTIGNELRRLTVDPGRLSARVAHILNVATSMRDLYEALSLAEQVELVAEVFGAIVLSRDGIVGFTLRPPFDRLASAAGTDPRKASGEGPAALVHAILDAA
jgi:DNA invertase Pin-like site-specific DNA recombinase